MYLPTTKNYYRFYQKPGPFLDKEGVYPPKIWLILYFWQKIAKYEWIWSLEFLALLKQ